MKTKSAWGTAGTRLYTFIRRIKREKGINADICVIGASDGKFVLPFLRNGFNVTAVDFDKTALYGGQKIIPKKRNIINKTIYTHMDSKPTYIQLPTEVVYIDGLKRRAEKESLSDKLKIIETDAYRDCLCNEFDAVFTSCSIQYKSNRDLPVEEIMNKLKALVKPNGYLYMDYMMPLEESHTWKEPHFFRNREILQYFNDDWIIHYIKEMRKPIFEAAHIDRPEDHFHRFGYILAQRR